MGIASDVTAVVNSDIGWTAFTPECFVLLEDVFTVLIIISIDQQQ